MASDMLAALARATPDGVTLFAHNCNRPRGQGASLVFAPGRDHAPGDTAPACHGVPEPRHTWAVLAGPAPDGRGYAHGVNEKGVAIGCTPVATRLLADGGEALTGPELVRLGLERAATAYGAVEVLTDLISRHGQGGGATPQTMDSAFLIADAREAYVLEAAGAHWALAQIGSVRAVTGACMLRKDWDRISRGLSDLAISRGWWPEDGCKLDFAGVVGRVAPDHAALSRRWGKATMALEQHSSQVDPALVRHVLRDLAELVSPADGPPSDQETASSFLVRMGPNPDDLPVAWCALGSPAASVYLPLFPVAELPEGVTGRPGQPSRLWRDLTQLGEEARTQPRLRGTFRTGLADLQERLDEHAHDFIAEARSLHRRGLADELRRLAGSFMSHCAERVEDLIDALRSRPGGRMMRTETVMQGADF